MFCNILPSLASISVSKSKAAAQRKRIASTAYIAPTDSRSLLIITYGGAERVSPRVRANLMIRCCQKMSYRRCIIVQCSI